jgi:hypothetical protein
MAEPAENTYVITVVLRGVRKAQALTFSRALEQAAFISGIPSKPEVFTAHLKDES